ncbi:MAG: MltA domain-containing protein, partial [Ideonella sp.]
MPEIINRAQSRWVGVQWSDLPDWQGDHIAEIWPALLLGCERPAAGWQQLCASARAAPAMDDAALRDWLQARLRPYQIESIDGNASGLVTGYFEPLIEASRQPRGASRIPLYQAP